MKFALYGLPCAGKSTLLNQLNIKVLNGSKRLNEMSNGKFKTLSEDEKIKLRRQYANEVRNVNDDVISDGHFAFPNGVVYTEDDAKTYDVFFYLWCQPKILKERIEASEKNAAFANISEENIKSWQNFEIEKLREECHHLDKDFYVISDISAKTFSEFIENIKSGFSSFNLAKNIAEKITSIYPIPDKINIVDGDKTAIVQDSFRLCAENSTTDAFDNDFYTGYQSFRFSQEINHRIYDFTKLENITINKNLSDVFNEKYVILSSGVQILWDKISEKFAIKNIIADTRICADTKYFVIKILKEKGYIITAYGDAKNDIYMLKIADKGYICVTKKLSRSLKNCDTSGLGLIYNKSPFILGKLDSSIKDDISICKSNSGINGGRLAAAHLKLGQKLGEKIRQQLPQDSADIVVLDRGGRFFGDGIYTAFSGVFHSFNPKKDEMPILKKDRVLIVDSVINSGKSIFNIIQKILEKYPKKEIYIAVNVIREDTLDKLKNYKLFAIRTSRNSFIGSNTTVQKNGKGPDTADRLFNLIE